MTFTLMKPLKWIQSKLNFEGWAEYPQFSSEKSLGRTALIGSLLGIIFGVHLAALAYFLIFFESFNSTTVTMLIQWVLYILLMCIFHLAEFFVTAIWTPSALSTQSFLVNHSLAYTTAFSISSFEFWARFVFFRSFNNVPLISFGLFVVMAGQSIRSIAMKTCGESFNHFIQYSNGENHRLITHGIYKHFRHPSYLGYFYWAIGTQILLCNPISFICYVYAAWKFFSLRIPYEEKTLLMQYHRYYADYMKKTWIGIPFIHSQIPDLSPPSNTPSNGNETENVDKNHGS